jgi:hypothetical protein
MLEIQNIDETNKKDKLIVKILNFLLLVMSIIGGSLIGVTVNFVKC